jgi:integrase
LAEQALHCRPQTVHDASTALGRLLRETGWQTVEDVNEVALNEWRAARIAGGLSHRTINRHVIALRAALALALRRRVIAFDPLSGVRSLSTKGRHRRRVARALPDTDIRRLLDAAASIDARHPSRFPREPLLRALILTGCRWGELVACVWLDLDTERGSLRLRGEHTKTAEERWIPLDPTCFRSILALRDSHVRVTGELPQSGSRIFLTPNGKPWPKCPTNFHRFLSEAMRVARIPKPMRRVACSTSTRRVARS